MQITTSQRQELAPFIVDPLEPARIRAMSRISNLTIHKSRYTSVDGIAVVKHAGPPGEDRVPGITFLRLTSAKHPLQSPSLLPMLCLVNSELLGPSPLRRASAVPGVAIAYGPLPPVLSQ